MNRLYVAESQYSTTVAMADHRLAVRSLDIGTLVADLAKRVQAMLDAGKVQNPAAGGSRRDRILQAMAADLFEHRGTGLIAVGLRQPAEVHAQVHRLNALLENAGKTVTYTDEPAAGYAAPCGDLADLAKRMQAGQVKTLVLLGETPCMTLRRTWNSSSAGQGGHGDPSEQPRERNVAAMPVVVAADASVRDVGRLPAQDGTICVTQPLIETLLGGKSTLELLALLLGDKSDSQTLVRRAVDRVAGRTLSDKEWRKLLHDGFLADSGLKPASVELKEPAAAEAKPAAEGDLELVFCRSETVYDGRFANNGWLQETPHLVSKLTWDNAALVSPATAKKLGLEIGSMVRLELGGRSLEIPAFILPGQADGSIGVALGYGRTSAGLVGGSAQRGIAPVGVNVSPLRTTAAMDMAAAVKVTPIGGRYPFALTQDHHAIDKVGLEAIGHRVGELIREARTSSTRPTRTLPSTPVTSWSRCGRKCRTTTIKPGACRST